MILATTLRIVAVAIAVAAIVDPEFVRSLPQRERLTLATMDDRSVVLATRVQEGVNDLADVVISPHQRESTAAACPDDGRCVMLSAGDTPRRISAGARLVAVVHADRPTNGSVIVAVDAAAPVSRNVPARLRVTTSRPVSRIAVFDGETFVGSAEPGTNTIVDVPWIPVDDGARVLRVTADNDSVHVGTIVESAETPVLFYEPQATWLGTFVRRSLEDDARFAVRGRTRLAPPVAVTRGDSGLLTASALDAVNAVVVSAPDLLTGSEVDLLERFVVSRGGSLIVVSDRRPAGAALRLLPRVVGEQREPQPRGIGVLRASEWVAFATEPGTMALAAVGDAPVVVSRAVGRGQVIVSGALDAWRYRDATDRFDQFWTTLAWDAARVAGGALRLATDRVIAAPGELITVTAELQSLVTDPASASDVTAGGRVSCGSAEHVLRLWPTARAGAFQGTFRIDHAGDCRVHVTVGSIAGTTPVTIRDDLRRVVVGDERLSAIAAAHGALYATEAEHDALIADLRDRLAVSHQPTPYRPMRSPYWLIAFALCLSGEWWLRRRRGLS